MKMNFNSENIIEVHDGIHDGILPKDTLFSDTHDQMKDNKNIVFNQEVKLKTDEGFNFSFNYRYVTEDEKDNNIVVKNITNNQNDMLTKDEMRVLETDNIEGYSGNEVYKTNIVKNNFFVNTTEDYQQFD